MEDNQNTEIIDGMEVPVQSDEVSQPDDALDIADILPDYASEDAEDSADEQEDAEDTGEDGAPPDAQGQADEDEEQDDGGGLPGTQEEFNRVAGDIRREERQRTEQRMAGEVAFANKVRTLFGGMTDEAIDEALIAYQAKQLAYETGWDEEEARAKVLRRMEYAGQASPAPAPQNDYIARMTEQMHELHAKHEGLNMVDVLKGDPWLNDEVAQGRMDLHAAYAYHLGTRRAAPKRRTAAPVARATRGGTAALDISKMSDADFDKIDQALKRGEKVRLN